MISYKNILNGKLLMMTDPEYQALLTRAEAGDGDAQFALGYHFDVELHDYAAAWKWYQAAAGQKCSAAWNNMAYMLVDGEGRPADPALAVQYFRKAVELGDEDGWYNCACTLEEIAATAEEWREVIGLYRKCNRSAGYYNLGLLYDCGNEFIPIDHRKANRWYRRAADAGDAEAATNLGANLHEGTGCRRNRQESFRYTRFAAENGDSLAFRSLAQDYALGDGIRRNDFRAFYWFKRSWLVRRDAPSAGWIGDFYARGRGVKKDVRKAYLWFKRAAKQGEEGALFDLGFYFVSGDRNWPKDAERGRAFLEQYLTLQPDDDDALYWKGVSYGTCRALAIPCFERIYRKNRDPWSAYRMVKLKIPETRYWAPEEFARLSEMLRSAARGKVPGAVRFLHCRRWKRLRSNILTSEELAEKYRRSLRWSDGNRFYIREFHRRGGRAEFEICRRYLQSGHWQDVITGANLLSQLGCSLDEKPFADESTALLISRMAGAGTDDVRRCLLYAIAWQDTEAGRKFLLDYVDHPNSELRHVAAWGLTGKSREELAALLKLTHDPEEDVRDWAVFNLIKENGELYPELQAGLTELAGSTESLMRYQAIAALAARHALNAEALLRLELGKTLSEGYELNYLEDAARYLDLPELLGIDEQKIIFP